MEIKRTLKSLDVSISRLASDLGISRPTLDTYIDCFENGGVIPNKVYQDIFEYLFSSENINTIEFAKRFDYVKRIYLQSQSNETAKNHEQAIRNAISDFIYGENVSLELLEFLNLLVSNSEMELVISLSNYFNYVNGIKKFDIETAEDNQKALFSNLYSVFGKYKSGQLQINENAYEQFVDMSEMMFEKKSDKSSDDELLEYLQKHLPDGSTIDLEYVKKLLGKKENI